MPKHIKIYQFFFTKILKNRYTRSAFKSTLCFFPCSISVIPFKNRKFTKKSSFQLKNFANSNSRERKKQEIKILSLQLLPYSSYCLRELSPQFLRQQFLLHRFVQMIKVECFAKYFVSHKVLCKQKVTTCIKIYPPIYLPVHPCIHPGSPPIHPSTHLCSSHPSKQPSTHPVPGPTLRGKYRVSKTGQILALEKLPVKGGN